MKINPTFDFELSLKKQGYKYIIGVDEAGRGCEYPDAEILTDNGWKYYYDIDRDEDKVLSYTSEGNIEWQSVDFIVEKEFDGNLIELKNRSAHILVTPDHCFDVLRRTFIRNKSDNNKLKMSGYIFNNRKNVKDLVDNDYIPRGGNWIGKQDEFFILPSVEKNVYDHSNKNYSEQLIPMDVWVSFMGIYLSEGNCRYSDINMHSVTISQSKSSKHYQDIKILLSKMPFTFNEVSVGFTTYNKQLSMYLRQFGNKYTKFIPKDIKSLCPSYLNMFIRWAIKGDGTCYTGIGRQEVCVYYTVSTKLRDDFEEVLLKAGWTYKTSIRKPRDGYIRGRLILKENQKDCFEIRLRRNNKVVCKHLHKQLIPYNGKVFCLSLSKHHNFYVRRSGSGYFTGNSLAGPVAAAAVYMPEGFNAEGINDSKKLSSKKRELFYNKIVTECEYSVAFVDERIIDSINIREATKLAMQKAINYFNDKADFAIIDGNFIPDMISIPARPIIDGDALSFSIAAASIVAKFTRDAYMEALDYIYPIYGFAKHKGYGTKYHLEAIRTYGPSYAHRKTFGGVKEYV